MPTIRLTLIATLLGLTSLHGGFTLSDYDSFAAVASKTATWTTERAPNAAGDGITRGSWDVGPSDARWLGETRSGSSTYAGPDADRLQAVEDHLGRDLNWSTSHPDYVRARTSPRMWDNGFLFQSETGPGEQYLAFRITFATEFQARSFRQQFAPTGHSPFFFAGYDSLGDTDFSQIGAQVDMLTDNSNPDRATLTWFVRYGEASPLNGVFWDDDPFLNDNESFGITCFNGIASVEIASLVNAVPEPSVIIALISIGLIATQVVVRARRKNQNLA